MDQICWEAERGEDKWCFNVYTQTLLLGSIPSVDSSFLQRISTWHLVRGCCVLFNAGWMAFPTLLSILIIHLSSNCLLFNLQIFTESLSGPNCALHCDTGDKTVVQERDVLGSWVGLGQGRAGPGSNWLPGANYSIFRDAHHSCQSQWLEIEHGRRTYTKKIGKCYK